MTICAEASGGRTVISELSGTEPWRPRIVSGHSGIAAVALVQTRASLIAGDDVALSITVGAGARLEVTEIGAMLAHDVRRGPAVSLRTEIAVGCGGVLIWVGKPLIAGDGSSTVRTTSVALSGSGQALLGEALVLGRARETPGALTARIRLTADAEAVLDETLDTRDLDTLRSPIVAGNASMISSLTLAGLRDADSPHAVMQARGPATLWRSAGAAVTGARTMEELAARWRRLLGA